jgi:hypothetical protein
MNERDDWTILDYEHEAYLAKVLKEEGWKAYCRLVDAETELFMHQCHGGHLS